MQLGMPVVAVASTEATRAVPADGGVVSADLAELSAAVREWINDPDLAQRTGMCARDAALANYGIEEFLRNWDGLLGQAVH